MTPWEQFAAVARGEKAGCPVALIVDSPWLPGYGGIDTLDYFLNPETWLRANLEICSRFPSVAWIPGFWAEYGMAAEPSAFGARVVWHHDGPPAIEHVRGGLATLAGIDPADPELHGLMPLVLQNYRLLEPQLAAEGKGIKMVAARGPLAVAGWLLGISDLMIAIKEEPEKIAAVLDALTETIIAFLRAQLGVLRAPEGILLLDDIPGLLSPRTFANFAAPYMARIFGAFPGLIRVYHNDTPCKHLLPSLAKLDFEVWNFSHEMDIAAVQAAMPGKALMGNVPPLALMVRGTPDEIKAWARDCIARTNGRGLILSAGGGVSPGTPASAIDALVEASL